MTNSTNRDRVNSIIAQAKAAGKLVPVVENVWRAIGEKDIHALEKLVASTPANPALDIDVCDDAKRRIERLMNPLLDRLTASRSTIFAFNKAALNDSSVSELNWSSMMEALERVAPTDYELDAIITQLYGVVKTAVDQALQGAAAAVAASATPASNHTTSKQTAPRKRDKLAAKSLEVV
ncbi:MAG: hypothetical protein HHJ17_02810 [Rhodoferax sp.]|uniref:hypothetical protein n=1 Tax=Rhodoferax sp. TaxID=50421 RepID=UPI0018430E00|nr:hypothetical protein [Rhodoferax sp.]NMM12461.1 hypothetical protein [Rhodoferax sp.]NMM21651.1 hypothetical protein [Rhodoferax sp.]